MVTSKLGDPNSIRMVSLINADGRTLPLCLLEASRDRVTAPRSGGELCTAIADGSLKPDTWGPITNALPIVQNDGTYGDDLDHRYGRSEEAELLNVDLQNDGTRVNLLRFTYESGAACGSTQKWLSDTAPDLSRKENSPLNGIFSKLAYGPLDVYSYRGTNYLHASDSESVDQLVVLHGNAFKQACEFKWKTRTEITRLIRTH
jgi:hypothetical protein